MNKKTEGLHDSPEQIADVQNSARDAEDAHEPAFIEDDGTFTEVPEFITRGDSASHVDPRSARATMVATACEAARST